MKVVMYFDLTPRNGVPKLNNLLYSDPTTRRKLVVCCANFITSLLCSVGPVSKALCAKALTGSFKVD